MEIRDFDCSSDLHANLYGDVLLGFWWGFWSFWRQERKKDKKKKNKKKKRQEERQRKQGVGKMMMGGASLGMGNGLSGHNDIRIREVWANNLEEEFTILREIIDDYPFISMDTEFPGVVARPTGSFKSNTDYHYQTLRCNVDMLKIIQFGISLTDKAGNPPPGNCCCWQFNFKFDLKNDMYAEASIKVLETAGINFERHLEYGIDVNDFGDLLMSSGLVLFDNVKWISFHSAYDFAYLIKVMSCEPLPEDESDFFELLRMYFPVFIDIKFVIKNCFAKTTKGGLQELADALKVERIGPQHQAGSDSLLTSATYFKLQQLLLDHRIDEQKFLCLLYGLDNSQALSKSLSSSVTSPPSPSSSSSIPPSSPSTPPPQQMRGLGVRGGMVGSPEGTRRSLTFGDRRGGGHYKEMS